MGKAALRETPYKGGSATVFALFNESTRRGWTYARIAEEIGVGPSTVSSWWRGDRKPGIDNVERWARAMNGFLVFSLPAELPAPEREARFRPQMDEWSRESRKRGLIGYAGRE